MSIPISVLEDDKQHAMWYSQSLPYGHLLGDETEAWLQDIVDHLVLSVKIRDFAPGALSWMKQLTNYLDLKHALPRTTRANLAKVLFQLTVAPGMDYALVEMWANTCVRLLRKKKKIGPEDLVLPWRPLYDMIERSVFPKARQKILISEAKHLSAVIRLVEYSQRFFDASATSEILDTFLPRFTTHSVHDAIVAQGYLVLFLPVTITNPLQRPLSPSASSHLSSTSMIYQSPKDYLPTIFSLWSMFTRSSAYDAQFMDLLARIAEHNMDYPLDNNNDKIGLFTKEQIKTVFTTSIRMMNLPVGSRLSDGGGARSSSDSAGSSGSSGRSSGTTTTTGYGHTGFKIDMKAGNGLFLRRKGEKYASLARFIIYTMIPEHNDKQVYTMTLLADLIQATELYFHPSNHGTWSYVLTTFVRHLAYEFLKRWRYEHEEDCVIPQERRLTRALCREFVLILRPVTFLSMFGKDQFTVGASQTTIKYLTWIEPSLIFPGLLERIYPSLETLTESHRTTSALSILADISLPLFSRDHYPAGGKHLLPLLQLAIPGIDMNDPIKTIASLMFITSALMTIPVMDLSSIGTTDYYDGDEAMMMDDDNMQVELPKELEDQLCRMTTSGFEEWLSKFLRRIFTIFENMPQYDRKKQGGAMEAGLTQMILHACETVFGQLSDSMYDIALRSIVDFASNQVLPNAVRAMGSLCESIASVNPKKAARQFIPMCVASIKIELENGASSTMTNSATSNPIQSDATLHWYQHILFSVISDLGPEWLQYKDDLINIGNDMITHCRSRRGIMWTGKFLRFSLQSLLDTYPTEYRSLTPEEWDNKDIMDNSHLLWGKPGDPKNLQIKWHIPNEDEKNMALDILKRFLQPSMARLREIISFNNKDNTTNSSHQVTNEFCRHLAIIRNCVIGSMTMIDNDGETEYAKPCENDDEDEVMIEDDGQLQKQRQHSSVLAGYAFMDKNDPRSEEARAIRRDVGELLHQLAEYFRTQREDDVESIKILIKLIRTYLTERGVEKTWLDRNKSGYNYSKNISKTPICHKRYPRHLLVHRAYIQHLQRLKLNASNRIRAPIHDHLLKDLLELSMSSYAEIRKVSQSALSIAARSFKGSKSILMPIILDTLRPKQELDTLVYSNRMKGALYLLTHKSILMPCLRDWRFIPEFILSICNAQHEDKPSIQELIRKIFLDYLSYFNQCSFRVIISETRNKGFDEDVEALLKSTEILGATTNVNRLQVLNDQQQMEKLEHIVLNRNAKQRQAHEQLTKSLLVFLSNPRIHWRFATMASNFLELLLRPELAPTADLAVYFAKTCTISELPAMRRIGISATTQLLLHIKQRTFAAGNEDLLIMKATHHPLKTTRSVLSLLNEEKQRPSETKHHSLAEMLLKDSSEQVVETSFLIDNTITGWYVWPKEVVGYVPYSDSITLPSIDVASVGAYDAFEGIFSSTDYWSKLMSYMSQEPSQKQDDRFNSANARFFASIFQTYRGEDILRCAKEQLTILCQSVDQKNAQRAATELAAGLIRGTKHWPLAQTHHLWKEWLTPLLRTTLANVTPDAHTYWSSFIRFCMAKRDPRRVKPLMDLLLEAQFDPQSDAAFAEARKLLFIHAMVVGLKWRFKPWGNDLLGLYLNHLNHPYKQVREVIGANINDIMQIQWIPSYSSVSSLLDYNARSDGVGNVPYVLNQAEQQKQLEDILAKLDSELETVKSASETAEGDTTIISSHYTTTSKTILCWSAEALTHWQMAGTLAYIPSFLPRVFQMQEVNNDQNLQQMATQVVTLMAQMTYPPQMIPGLVDQLINTLITSTSWHIRIRTLPVLQVFFFKHIFAMDLDQQVVRIMQAVGTLLLDSQIEVRTMAGVTLGGLVRCSQRGAIDSLRERYTALLEQTKLPKRHRNERGKLIEPEGFREALLQKHAGVLGLSCLVNAFPYEVPEWMPSVLCQLANCMSDPAEIQSTIRKTFSDFRRTHSDTWHEDVTKFSEDQLSVLSDMLISPSYYA
ncbi:uncharacterized protein BX664DRAFT_272366 [Halteromyces radiatus]|uniref:uncharacterized protein n=1 Tax=Halteromyces radiatus TaxID=101107 RepID=UPI00221E9762|nr:uncharacterized protein BX664DRAFT_272366 [Halteromyces radiatus]KAI8099232.1 hypothetical protein BX664DRAFT_272366 [Halteromyces radiatus]